MEYYTKPRIPEGAVHLIIGDSLVRVLTSNRVHLQVGIFSFSGAAMHQMLASLEMLEVRKIRTITIMMGTNDVSRGEARKMMREVARGGELPLAGGRDLLGPYSTYDLHGTIQYDAGRDWDDMKERVRQINVLI